MGTFSFENIEPFTLGPNEAKTLSIGFHPCNIPAHLGFHLGRLVIHTDWNADVGQPGQDFIVTLGAFPSFAADFDVDEDVDGDDLAIWSANFEMSAGAAYTQGDANADGAVDGADFLIWQQQLGSVIGAQTGTHTATPEPASLVLFACKITEKHRLRFGPD
jgi:hypothetical protein